MRLNRTAKQKFLFAKKMPKNRNETRASINGRNFMLEQTMNKCLATVSLLLYRDLDWNIFRMKFEKKETKPV